jgi:hypothetical protein
MRQTNLTPIFLGILACWSAISVIAEDRYQFFTWEITYGTIFPLGVPQEVGLFYFFPCHLNVILFSFFF